MVGEARVRITSKAEFFFQASFVIFEIAAYLQGALFYYFTPQVNWNLDFKIRLWTRSVGGSFKKRTSVLKWIPIGSVVADKIHGPHFLLEFWLARCGTRIHGPHFLFEFWLARCGTRTCLLWGSKSRRKCYLFAYFQGSLAKGLSFLIFASLAVKHR